MSGERRVRFEYCVSFVVGTLWRQSPTVVIPAGGWAWWRGLPYTLISLTLGWWGVPWGLFWTPWSVAVNLCGGREADG